MSKYMILISIPTLVALLYLDKVFYRIYYTWSKTYLR